MTAEEWIHEFSPHSQQQNTVLHASNVPAAAPAATPAARPDDVEAAASPHVASRRYPLGALCIAGLVGFVVARTL